jgi:hypothetical protein
MSVLIDNAIAYRILKLLVTPFNKSDAFKYGIIDDSGKVLRKANTLTKSYEKNSYTYLHRLVFNLKRLLKKLPGGDTYTKNLIAAYMLIKESYITDNAEDMEVRLIGLVEELDSNHLVLVEEELAVLQFLEGENTPTNNTSQVSYAEKPLTAIIRRKKTPKRVIDLMKMECIIAS